jgi:hypothetical protein
MVRNITTAVDAYRLDGIIEYVFFAPAASDGIHRGMFKKKERFSLQPLEKVLRQLFLQGIGSDEIHQPEITYIHHSDQHHRGIFQIFFQIGEEPGGISTVHEPVIGRESGLHHPRRDDSTFPYDHGVMYGGNSQNSGLIWINDRGELIHPEHPGLETVKVPPEISAH